MLPIRHLDIFDSGFQFKDGHSELCENGQLKSLRMHMTGSFGLQVNPIARTLGVCSQNIELHGKALGNAF